MQNQVGQVDKLAVVVGPAGVTSGQVVTVGDTLGIAYDTVKAGARAILAICGEFSSRDVIDGEAWAVGQRLYWHETLDRFTNRATHWPVGRAGEDKASGAEFGIVQLDKPDRNPGDVIVPFNFEQVEAEFKANGDLVLRSFDQSVQIVMVEFASASLAPGEATFSLGDGTGDNDQILPATAASGLSGFKDLSAITGGKDLPVVLDKLVLRIAGGPIVSGMLTVRVAYAPAA